jgi:cyclophilin family peptidyl-prolyl cis-trans isomerase
VAVAACAAAPLFAAVAENTLVIEVAGETSGTIEIELLPDVAPQHVERIKRLAREGLYDDVVFHRVIPGFMAQTGDVEHGKREGYNLRFAGMGGSALPDLPAEFSDINYDAGVVGMARSAQPNSANSQFFIMFAEGAFLNGQYTVVGRISSGQDVVNTIKKGDESANGAVAEPDYMKSVKVKSDTE